MRVLGIDYGRARLGIAASDPDCRIALPVAALNAKKDLRKNLGDIVRGREITRVVIGYPLNRDGLPGLMADEVRAFSERVSRWYGVECVLWDERFTSSQAATAARKSGDSKNKGRNDMAAATLILQSYLDSINR